MIADEDMVITVTSSGYVKRSPLSLYRAQGRGGKGSTGMTTKDGDFVEHLFVASAHSYVLVFTQSGRVFWIKVHEIPQAGPAAKGKAIVNLLNLEGSDEIATTIAVRDFAEDRYLVFATEKGTIKKTALSEYGNPRAGGIIAINLDEGDRLLSVKNTDGTKHLFLATADGMSIRFPESDCRADGAGDRRRARHLAAQGRPGDRHGGAREGGRNPHRRRARRRQAHADRRVPRAGPRRPRDHQPQGERQDRQGGRHRAGAARATS